MKDKNCAYCMHGELLDKFGVYICDLKGSSVFLFKEQSKKGRVVVAANKHISEITDLSNSERSIFINDVAFVASAIRDMFKPDKINYGAFGDKGGHLHMHIVPKYKDGDEWGGTFQMNPERIYLSDGEYNQLIIDIKERLS